MHPLGRVARRNFSRRILSGFPAPMLGTYSERAGRVEPAALGPCGLIQEFVWFGMGERAKLVEFRGSALHDLRAFPIAARREAGHQLDQVQQGRDPDDWKPMNTVGQGVREIRIRDETGAFRVIYVAKFGAAIYVLHCFQKKTQKTRKADLDVATKRYRDLVKELNQ